MDARFVRWVAWERHATADLLAISSRIIVARAVDFVRAAAAALLGSTHQIGRGAATAGAIAALVGVAYANTIPVMERPRPDYDAKGVPLGAFRAFPTLDTALIISDNVFQTTNATKSDVKVQASPAIKIVSEWSQHLLEFYGRLSADRFADYSSENVTDWEIGAKGRLDIQRGSAAFAEIFDSVGHEGRSSPNSPGNIAELVRYSLFHAGGSISVQPNHLHMLLALEHNRYSYDATRLNGGGFLNNSDRDRDEFRVRGRVSLEVSEGYLGFVEAAFDTRDFDRTLDRTGVNRDSDGLNINVGMEFALVEFLQGEAFIGHIERQFETPLRDFSGFNYGATLKWSATPLTTVRFDASRVLNDTTVAGASVASDRSIGIGIDHELRRNVIIQASLARIDSEFVGIPREDESIEGRLGAIYLIDRNLSANAGYERLERESNVAGEDFSEDRFNVGLRVQF
jgi:hypothetical protein